MNTAAQPQQKQRCADWRAIFAILILPFASMSLAEVDGRAQSAQDSSPTEELTLTTQLIGEGYETLAQAARQLGNPVQGSIYFAQQQLRCTECHARGNPSRGKAGDGKHWLGPNLSLLKEKRSDSSVVESLLDPSAAIEMSFQTTQVLTDDGRQYSGRMVESNDQELLLQQLEPPYSILRISMDEIINQAVSRQSAMPSGLVDSLGDRQAFLDLVSYLYQLIGSAENSKPALLANDSASLDQQQRILGLALMDEYRCAKCHERNSDGLTGLPSHVNPMAPNLKEVSSRSSADYLRRFIANPHTTKPGTVMPDLMKGMSTTERLEIAELIVDFLDSLKTKEFDVQAIRVEAEKRGETAFHSVGCVACHSAIANRNRLSDVATESTPPDLSNDPLHIHRESLEAPVDLIRQYPLGNLSAKYSLDSLTQFLEDPTQARPSGRMPNMALTHWEAEDIASYLLSFPVTVSASTTADKLPLSSSVINRSTPATNGSSGGSSANNHPVNRIATGRTWFAKLNCNQCHAIGGMESESTFTSFDQLDPSKGCLAEEPTGDPISPDYQMRHQDRQAIQFAIEHQRDELGESDKILWTLQSLRCISCHDRDGVGGVEESLDLYFTTTNQNLGPQGRLPPTLTSVGAKLNPKWLRQVLVSGRSIRPYMLTRMPQFGLHNVEYLLDAFHSVDHPMEDDLIELEDTKEVRDAMTEMIGRGGLNCIACHTFQNQGADTMPALDLTEMAERLQPGWFYQYMLSPQSIRPNTVMPSFWPGGQSIRKEMMDGTAQTQISGIWKYLQRGRQASTPRGLQVEPIELLADSGEAVMLRRSYPNIGKRGIGVGYPLGLNLAFDAEQMRLALMWKGGFADPGGVWRGQGHGRVRPLSPDVWNLAAGPDLDSQSQPWEVDEGRPPDHQFTGYHLDDQQRPAFTYRFQDIEVEDYFVDRVVSDASSGNRDGTVSAVMLQREVLLKSDREVSGLRFRIATGKEIQKLSENQFLIDQRVRIITPAMLEAKVVPTGEMSEVQLRLNASAGESKIEVQYVW